MDPDAIESATGLAADFSAAKGQVRRVGTKREIRQPSGVWLMTSKGRIQTTSVERHLIWLLERLEPVREGLLTVAHDQGAAADFGCYWVRASDQGGPGIGADTLRRISDLKAELWFDLYGPWDDD